MIAQWVEDDTLWFAPISNNVYEITKLIAESKEKN